MDKSISNNIISVIVPVYNSQEYLDACIHSIIDQTYHHLELILIDDGSTDDSGKICDIYANVDNRIQVVHKQNEGLVAARKTGLEIAQGEYISFVDSDDFIDLDTYEVVLKRMNGKRPDMVLYDLVEEFLDDRCIKRNHFQAGHYVKKDIMNEIIPSMLSYGDFFDFGILPNLVCKMIRRDFANRVNIIVDTCITIGEDAAHTYQLIPYVSELLILDYAPYHYCRRNHSMMWENTESDKIAALEKNLKESFQRAGIEGIMDAQLKRYISFVTLLKIPSCLLRNTLPFSNDQLRVALYGAGGMGQAVYSSFSSVICLWVDREAKKFSESDTRIKEIDDLFNYKDDYDVIFVAILNASVCNKVSRELRERGIDKNIYYYDGDGMICV